MEQPSHWGDELAFHLLAVMNQIHYCIIKKTKVFYIHPTAFSSPSAVHVTLVYLRNSIFRDTTTLPKKCPPPPHSDFNQPLPQDTTPRAAHHKNPEEQKRQQQESQSEYAQESDQEMEEYAQESQPSPPRKGSRCKRTPKIKVYKTKEYKIRQKVGSS